MQARSCILPGSGAAVAWLLGTAVSVSGALGESGSEATLDAVIRAWSQRQENTRALRFVWDQTLTVRKAPPIDEDSAERSGPADSAPGPGEMVTVQQTITLTLDRDKLAYAVETEGARALSMPPYYKSTYDGKSSRMYAQVESDDPRLGTGTGVIRGEAHAFDTDSIQVRPLLLCYRPLHPALGRIDPADYRLGPERGWVGDASCLIIEHAGDQQPHKFYWVDPDRDFIVLRESETYRGIDRIRKDIKYERDATHGWVPTGWSFVNLDENGELRETASATVSEYSINAAIPSSEFEIQYPEGTYLTDARGTPERSEWIGGNPQTAARGAASRTVVVILNALVIGALAAWYARRRYLQKQRRMNQL